VNLRSHVLDTVEPRQLLCGNAKGVGRIDQQTFLVRFSRVAFAKLYDRKTPIVAADLLNGRVRPFFGDGGRVLHYNNV